MPFIIDIFAREILDSRGNPTIETEVKVDSGAFGKAIVPSGASTGKNEALELRDNDKKRYNGLGVLKAVKNVNRIIAKKLIGFNVTKQNLIDRELIKLDGTKKKSFLGANSILSVSLACARAAADHYKMPLFRYLGGINSKKMPIPLMNIINGGAHANTSVDFQEYMIIPLNTFSIKEAIRIGVNVFQNLKFILKKNKYSISVGDEGGFAPNLKNNEEPIKLIIEAIKLSNYIPGKDVAIALDVAASEFYNIKKKKYIFFRSNKKTYSSNEMIEFYKNLINKYPFIISIEDPMSEHDIYGWKKITKILGKKIQIVGDDLFVTNPKIFKNGIKNELANSILIKPNQIGTLTETFDTIELAKNSGYTCIISHRSGESEDSIISDISVAVNAGQIKTGSLCRSERLAKYNQLIRLEENLKFISEYDGINFFKKNNK